MNRYLGVDLGGTGTRIVLADEAGTVLADRSVPTATDRALALSDLSGVLSELVTASAGTTDALCAIGIGASGPVDADGVVQNPATLAAYTGLDLVGALGARFGVPVLIDNDAVTAAYAEARLGAGRGARAVLMITLGTGVGVAMITDGRPWRTASGAHPEAGHLWVPGHAPCYCGREACWEQAASRSTLQRALRTAGFELDEAHTAARAGDPQALELFAAYGRSVGDGLADLLTLLGPDRVVIGGGGARFLDVYGEVLDETLSRIAGCTEPPPIVQAELGDLAGAIGAALWAASSPPDPEPAP